MENSGGIKASLQGRYASALFDLASENGVVSAVETDLDNLGQALRESDELAALIRNPQISRDAAAKASPDFRAEPKALAATATASRSS